MSSFPANGPDRNLAKLPVFTQSFIDADLITCETDEVRAGYLYWRSKYTGDLPSRQDLDPIQIPHLLPNIMLVDVYLSDQTQRLRFRLVGERHVEMMGRNPVGEYFDHMPEIRDDEGKIISIYHEVISRRQPHYWVRQFIDPVKSWRYYERVVCPLSSDGRAVDMLISFLQPFEKLKL